MLEQSPKKVRVLLIDDSAAIRSILKKILSEESQIEVVGFACDGSSGVQAVRNLNPDIVVMDIEMPVMDGLGALADIRKTHPKLPVIMFSTLSKRGAIATLDCLALGANDYTTKPEASDGPEKAAASVKQDLVPKILTLGRSSSHYFIGNKDRSGGAGHATGIKSKSRTNRKAKTDLVVIGVSTGGPKALMEILPHFPADFPVPILIVQHMPPAFTQSLAERLSQLSKIPVRQVGHDLPILEPASAWVAPGDYHVVMTKDGCRTRLVLNQDTPQNSCRPSVDVLFESAANHFGSNALGVILTGMGYDGLRGAELISKAGGKIFIQDEASSVVWGMPGAVAKAGFQDAVFPLNQMAQAIIRCVMEQRTATAYEFQ